MAKNKSCIKCLIGIFCTVCLLSGLVHTVFADLVTFSPSYTLLPIAISLEIADKYDMYDNNSSTIKIWSYSQYQTSEAGQWTSFQVASNSQAIIMDLIANGNPTPLSVGDDIWILPSTYVGLYSFVPVGVDVVMPIIQNIYTNSYVPIVGFIGFHITASVGGSGKYIEGYFLDNSSPAPIPEPSTMTMLFLGSGLIGLVGYGRKKFFKK